MDEVSARAVRESFTRLYREGLAYRTEALVNWCPGCRTSVSDLEVVPTPEIGSLWTIRYHLVGADGRPSSDETIAIATTRPETLLGDTAVAVNPADPRYAALVGRHAMIPFVDRVVPIIADDHVEQIFGTGAVKITPAHDHDDYAMAFLAKNPTLLATVCDRPVALDVAKEIASTHKAGARLYFLPLDVMTEDIPGTYDVIWYSNVLHIYSPKDNQALFRRALTSLNPGGRLLVQDAFLHDRNGLFPEEASLFAVSMLLFTERGNTYSAAETKAWLTDAGFERIKVLRMKKGTEDWEGGILEARLPGTNVKMRARRTGSIKSSRSRSSH
jgi:SAM-dependent methyltransferase